MRSERYTAINCLDSLDELDDSRSRLIGRSLDSGQLLGKDKRRTEIQASGCDLR